MVPQDQYLREMKQVTDGVDGGVGQLKALNVAWVVAELVSPSLSWDQPPQARCGDSSPAPMPS